jgi:hypothetical protein
MRFGELTSIAHNLATSISDGASMLFGAYGLDVHADATASPNGHITVDFITGRVMEGSASAALRRAIADSPRVLAELCAKHGADTSEFIQLEVRYGVDVVYGPHFTVTVEDQKGRRWSELFRGISGQRFRRAHREDQSPKL